MAIETLVHVNPDEMSDELLNAIAAKYHDEHRHLCVMSVHLANLRFGRFTWWTPKMLLERFSVSTRMEALANRPDIRQQITTKLTHLREKTARSMNPEEQANLFQRSLQSGDITEADVENAFDPRILVSYVDASKFWRLFREQMPWQETATDHRELVGALIGLILVNGILTHHEVLSAINRKAWQESIPLTLRVDIDEALLAREREHPEQPFLAKDILAIVGPREIAEFLPLTELIGIMDEAEKVMGFEKPVPVEVPVTPPAAEAQPSAPPPTPATEPEDQPTHPPPAPDAAPPAVSPKDDGSTDISVDDGDLEDIGDGDDGATIVGNRHSLDMTSLTATAAAAPSAKPGDVDRSSSGGITLEIMEKLAQLETAGFKIEPDPSMRHTAIRALHGMLVDSKWPTNDLDACDAMKLFMRSCVPKPPKDLEIRTMPTGVLELRFIGALSNSKKQNNQRLVEALQKDRAQQLPTRSLADRPSSPTPPRPPAFPGAGSARK